MNKGTDKKMKAKPHEVIVTVYCLWLLTKPLWVTTSKEKIQLQTDMHEDMVRIPTDHFVVYDN